MYNDEMEQATARMVNGIREFATGLGEVMTLAFQRAAETIRSIDWNALAAIKEADPDLFNWNASGPIRRVQLRRARAMMEGKRHGL